jgi:phosphoenolpyruvate carboxykinase (diphosphate)
LLLKKQIQYLKEFITDSNNTVLVQNMKIDNRLLNAEKRLQHIESENYLNDLIGTIGADPLFKGN